VFRADQDLVRQKGWDQLWTRWLATYISG